VSPCFLSTLSAVGPSVDAGADHQHIVDQGPGKVSSCIATEMHDTSHQHQRSAGLQKVLHIAFVREALRMFSMFSSAWLAS
jgi:hypothetical protein